MALEVQIAKGLCTLCAFPHSFRMLVVPGTFSVSCLPGFRNGLTSTPMLGCPGVCFDPAFRPPKVVDLAMKTYLTKMYS